MDHSRGAQQISIHAAREGGDQNEHLTRAEFAISIHAAREGGDCTPQPQSTHAGISIHAAREGGDVRTAFLFQTSCYFNPRRP